MNYYLFRRCRNAAKSKLGGNLAEEFRVELFRASSRMLFLRQAGVNLMLENGMISHVQNSVLTGQFQDGPKRSGGAIMLFFGLEQLH
jgi:hypothetical protein